MKLWGEICGIIAKFPPVVGLLIILIILLGCYIVKLYEKNIADKQRQIDELAKENKEYRDKFTNLLDKALPLYKRKK